jgi:hypothetical protein
MLYIFTAIMLCVILIDIIDMCKYLPRGPSFLKTAAIRSKTAPHVGKSAFRKMGPDNPSWPFVGEEDCFRERVRPNCCFWTPTNTGKRSGGIQKRCPVWSVWISSAQAIHESHSCTYLHNFI